MEQFIAQQEYVTAVLERVCRAHYENQEDPGTWGETYRIVERADCIRCKEEYEDGLRDLASMS
jgi:hypothetical protein